MPLSLTHPETLYLLELAKNTLHDINDDIQTKGGTFRKGLLIAKLREYEKAKRPAPPTQIIYELKSNGSYIVQVPRAIIRNNGFQEVIERVKEKLKGDVTFTKLPEDKALDKCQAYQFYPKTSAISKIAQSLDSMSKAEVLDALAKLQEQYNNG